MRRAALALLLSLCGTATAQPPPPKGVDEIAGKITAIDQQTAELAKQRAALVGDLKAELTRITDLVSKLNLNGPAPPPPLVPPVPADPLKAKLKAAYDTDPAAPDARRPQALDLAALYRAAADLARDEAIPTSGLLLSKVAEAAATLLKDPPGAKKLAGVRKVANGELAVLLPSDTALTAERREATAVLFTKLATFIEEIAK